MWEAIFILDLDTLLSGLISPDIQADSLGGRHTAGLKFLEKSNKGSYLAKVCEFERLWVSVGSLPHREDFVSFPPFHAWSSPLCWHMSLLPCSIPWLLSLRSNVIGHRRLAAKVPLSLKSSSQAYHEYPHSLDWCNRLEVDSSFRPKIAPLSDPCSSQIYGERQCYECGGEANNYTRQDRANTFRIKLCKKCERVGSCVFFCIEVQATCSRSWTWIYSTHQHRESLLSWHWRSSLCPILSCISVAHENVFCKDTPRIRIAA